MTNDGLMTKMITKQSESDFFIIMNFYSFGNGSDGVAVVGGVLALIGSFSCFSKGWSLIKGS
jgi:hypothetical protein